MAVLPITMRGRQRQPMNYATGTPNDTGSGAGQPPPQTGGPAATMNYGYGNYGRIPSMPGVQQQPMRTYAGIHPGAMAPYAGNNGGQGAAITPLMGRVNPGMGGMATISPLYGRVGGQGMPQGGGYNFAPVNPNMLYTLRRRGVLPTLPSMSQTSPLGSNANPYRVEAY